MHVKVLNNWSNKSFDMLLNLLKDAFSINTCVPNSFYETNRKLLRDLGLGYSSIHTCKYDCILFWKRYSNYQSCPVCGKSRYKIKDEKEKKDLKQDFTSFSIHLEVETIVFVKTHCFICHCNNIHREELLPTWIRRRSFRCKRMRRHNLR